MDAVKFIEERDRMYEVARQAPSLCYRHEKSAEEIVREVEEWSATHPRKTRQSVFLEQFPNVELDRNRIINISPCKVDPKQYPFNGKNCRKFQRCGECLREFWMQEVE